MGHADLVPSETCTRCSKSIGPKQKACLWYGDIVCWGCHLALNREKKKRDSWYIPFILEDESATPRQLAILAKLGVEVDPEITWDRAVDLTRSALVTDRLKHYLNGLWLRLKGHHLREYGVTQEQVHALAERIRRRAPSLAEDVNDLLAAFPHSSDFLRHSTEDTGTRMKRLLDEAFGKKPRSAPEVWDGRFQG
ncbi:MAG: hypothetical protein ACLQVA_00155 [Candidatus Brocadiia bacterium]